METAAQGINAAKKAELVRGDLGKAVQQLKRESGKGLFVGGVKLALALTELGLIDEYELAKDFDSPANNVGPWPASLGCTTGRCGLPGKGAKRLGRR